MREINHSAAALNLPTQGAFSVKPVICNRRVGGDERGRDFFDEKSESVALPTIELFEDEKVRHRSSNPTFYCKFRVKERLKDYIILTKPGITFVVLITASVGFLLGLKSGQIEHSFNFQLFLHVLIGTALTSIGAGTLNMLIEEDVDSMMERTKNRPLPARRIFSEEAFFIGILSSSIGIVHLAMMANILASFLAATSLVLYLVFYTPLKKLSPASSVVGAVSGALPPLIGWSGSRGTLDLNAGFLFLILFVWQFPHLLALSWIYRIDYKKANLKFLPFYDSLGIQTSRLALFFSVLLVLMSLAPFFSGHAQTPYLFISLALGTALVIMSTRFLLQRDDRSGRFLFLTTIIYIPLLLTAMVLLYR